MTISGVPPHAIPAAIPGHLRTPAQEPSQRQGIAPTPEQPQARPAHAAARASEAVPAEAPAGTDPMLWSVLTAEERSFFARARAMGQVTYGPGSRSQSAGIPRGGRLDVRV